MALRGTLTHRKTRRLARALAIPPCYALGILESLWHVTAERAPAGDIGRMTDTDLAEEMFYDDPPTTLVEALVEAGLLDRNPAHRLIVHDWHLYADDATDNKLSRSGRKYANGAMPRMRKMSEKERERACARFGGEPEALRSAAQSGAVDDEAAQSGAEPAEAAHKCALPESRIQSPVARVQSPEPVIAPSAAALEAEPTIGMLPLVNGSEWSYTAADVHGWSEAYPSVDVAQQLLQMREWCRAHPQRRKTARGISQFVVSWLSRAQDKGPRMGQEVTHGSIRSSQPTADARQQRIVDNTARGIERANARRVGIHTYRDHGIAEAGTGAY